MRSFFLFLSPECLAARSVRGSAVVVVVVVTLFNNGRPPSPADGEIGGKKEVRFLFYVRLTPDL